MTPQSNSLGVAAYYDLFRSPSGPPDEATAFVADLLDGSGRVLNMGAGTRYHRDRAGRARFTGHHAQAGWADADRAASPN
jgi:hypothetical protein